MIPTEDEHFGPERSALYFALLSVNSWHNPLVLLTNKTRLVSCTISDQPSAETLSQDVFSMVLIWIRKHTKKKAINIMKHSFTWIQIRYPSVNLMRIHRFLFLSERAIWHQQIICITFSQVLKGLPILLVLFFSNQCIFSSSLWPDPITSSKNRCDCPRDTPRMPLKSDRGHILLAVCTSMRLRPN